MQCGGRGGAKESFPKHRTVISHFVLWKMLWGLDIYEKTLASNVKKINTLQTVSYYIAPYKTF